MSIVRRAEIDMVGFNVGSDPSTAGQIAVRWAKLTYDAASNVILVRENHRAVLNPGDNIDAMMAVINADLTAQGFGNMPAADIDLVKAQAALIWTPAVVSAYQAWEAQQNAA